MALPVANMAKYELVLPSTGETIEFRPFLVKEEKILLVAMESEETNQILNAIKEVVKACTFNKVEPDNQPMFDIEYLFLQIRAKSVGEISKIRVLCPDDLTKDNKTWADVEVDLTTIEVQVDENHSNNILLDEDRKLGIVMRYPTLKEVKAEMIDQANKVDTIYDVIVDSMESIYEGDQVYLAKDSTKKELMEFLEGLTSTQLKKLNEFYLTAPRVEKTIKVTNPKTGVESEVTLKGLGDFFV